MTEQLPVKIRIIGLEGTTGTFEVVEGSEFLQGAIIEDISVSTDIVMVKLNGKDYPTHMVDGVQRFVENPIVNRLMDKIGDAYNKLGYRQFEALGLYGLNEIGTDFHRGLYTVEDMLDFYTQTDYSVSGMLDLSCFRGVTVENPLWKKK